MKKSINFVKLLNGYASGWVGISADFTQVILSGKTPEEIMQKSKDIKEKVYLFPAGESYTDFVG